MRFAASGMVALLVIGMFQAVQADEGKQSPTERMYLSVYGVGDLVRRMNSLPDDREQLNELRSEDFHPIMRFLQNKVAPQTWKSSGKGTGTMAPYTQRRQIVVSQTADAHDQIKSELSKLRDAYRVLDEFEQMATATSIPAK